MISGVNGSAYTTEDIAGNPWGKLCIYDFDFRRVSII